MTNPAPPAEPAGQQIAVIPAEPIPPARSGVTAKLLMADPRPESLDVFGSLDQFRAAQSMALALCKSSIVPTAYQGEANLGNVLIALDMAVRARVSVMAVMQNLHVIHGKPGWGSPFLIAQINASGRFTPLRFEFQGEAGKSGWGCRAVATDRATGTRLDGTWVTWDMAQKEGWVTRKDSKWATMPAQMIVYRAAAFWSRVFAPDVALGLHTAEEVEDMVAAPSSGSRSLADAIRAEAAVPATEARLEQNGETAARVTNLAEPPAAPPVAPRIHKGPGPCEACAVGEGDPHLELCPEA